MSITLTTVQRVPSDDLLRLCCIFAEPNFANKTSEHIRKKFCDEIGTFDIVRAASAQIKLNA